MDKNYDKVYIINPSTRCQQQCRSRWFKDKTHPFLKSLNKVKDEIISHMVIRWDHGAPIDCSPNIESMRSISSGIYDPHSLKSLASPHYLMAWYQGSNDQAWPNILLLGRISFLANDCSVDNGCQRIHNINAHSDLQGWKPKKNSPGLRLVPFFGKLPHESPQKIWKSGNEGFLS